MQMNKLLLSAGLLFSLTTLTAEASLTVGTADGKPVVYDNVTNITWTGDANLLGTLESTLGYSTVVNAIIAASPIINDTPNEYDTPINSGHYSVSSSDFFSGGTVTWFGAIAFTDYLNSINYAGSNQWTLPTVGTNPQIGYNQNNTQFGELFYNELGGKAGGHIPNTSYFTNEQSDAYWLGTEYATFPDNAWLFSTSNGYQNFNYKGVQVNAWAVIPGNLAEVPVPTAAWLFGSGLMGLAGVKRRGNTW